VPRARCATRRIRDRTRATSARRDTAGETVAIVRKQLYVRRKQRAAT
jgi:hypothetical protein